MTAPRPTLALCYLSYGPYHFARLKAAQRIIEGYNVIGVQMSARQSDYQWDQSADDSLVTVEPKQLPEDVPASRWLALVGTALEELNPACCAIAGYSHPSMLAAIQWCGCHSRPIILISDSTAADAPRTPWKEWLKSRVVSNCSAGFVAGEPHVQYLSQLGMPADRMALGCDAVDNEYFSRQAAVACHDRAQMEARLNLPSKYFLASARFLEKKNLARLLQAYSLYRSQLTASRGKTASCWDLVLLGDGPLRPMLERHSDSLDLSSHIRLCGFKQYDELPYYYGLAATFVHASTVEQWGLVVNEAMAAGQPVLVSNRCGCAPHLVEEGVNGYTFDPYDVGALADRMLQLSTMPDEQRAALGAASRQIVAQWGLDRFAAGLESAADKAMEVGPNSARIMARLVLEVLLRRPLLRFRSPAEKAVVLESEDQVDG